MTATARSLELRAIAQQVADANVVRARQWLGDAREILVRRMGSH